MTIDECLMGAGKTYGGLINITHKEAARTKWLLSAHVRAQYSDAIRDLTSTSTGTWSNQHRQMNQGCRWHDFDDLQKFINIVSLKPQSLHSWGNSGDLIATGLIADARVNVVDAEKQDKLLSYNNVCCLLWATRPQCVCI